MDEEFEKWATEQGFFRGEAAWALAKLTWLEATRRADRKAREECAEICKQRTLACGNVAEKCSEAIRATIKEDT